MLNKRVASGGWRNSGSWCRNAMLVCAGSLLVTSACEKSAPRACAPGASQACACPDGRQGAQSCKTDGASFGECACTATAPAASAAAAPGAAVVPAPAPPTAPTPSSVFVTTLGPLDHYSGKGVELATVAAVIRQDRFRVHTGRTDIGDEIDAVYSDDKARTELEKLVAASTIAAEVSKAVLERNPKVRVSVFGDRAQVELLEPGTDEVACVVSTNKVAGVVFPFDSGQFVLPSRMSARGWKVARAGTTAKLLEPSGAVAVEFQESAQAEIKSANCMTTHGVHLGSTLQEARRDTDFAANGCMCETDPSGAQNLALIVSKPRNDGVIYLRANCRKPMTCPGEGENVRCKGDWGRDDCIVSSISIGPPAGGM